MLDKIDPSKIADEATREIVIYLLNMVEVLTLKNLLLQEENQRLRDENNRLKGEQGKPEIRPQTPLKNVSSEKERYEPKAHHKKPKQNKIKIDREVNCTLDRATLPADAISKGYLETVVQDLNLSTDNVLFVREKYYSPSEKKSYLAPLPQGYSGSFGPALKTYILTSYFEANMSEPRILRVLLGAGIQISSGELSNMLINEQKEVFASEKEEILQSALCSSDYQQIDTTTTRIKGRNYYCQVITRAWYSIYYTGPGKTRGDVLQALTNGTEASYLISAEILRILRQTKVHEKWILLLEKQKREVPYTQAEWTEILEGVLAPVPKQNKALLNDLVSLAGYHAQEQWPAPKILVADNAKEFKLIAPVGLCWVHEGRHYKKLEPKSAYMQHILAGFREEFWEYYRALQRYQLAPDPLAAQALRAKFEQIFGTTNAPRLTEYKDLNERLALTAEKSAELLLVLDYPQIPLHNNETELGVRMRVRKRDVSFGPRSEEGRLAWDNVMTVVETGHKLGVSVRDYIYDRITGAYQKVSLGQLIKDKLQQLTFSGSP